MVQLPRNPVGVLFSAVPNHTPNFLEYIYSTLRRTSSNPSIPSNIPVNYFPHDITTTAKTSNMRLQTLLTLLGLNSLALAAPTPARGPKVLFPTPINPTHH